MIEAMTERGRREIVSQLRGVPIANPNVDLLELAEFRGEREAGDIIARRIREDEQGDRMEGDRFE